MIWVYPLVAIAAGLLLAFAALHQKGQRVAFALSVLVLVLGVSGWKGTKKAHCPSDDRKFLGVPDEWSVTCTGVTTGCCVELMPVSTSTCIMTEQSGPASISQTISHYYLTANPGVTAVAACIEWRPWKAW